MSLMRLPPHHEEAEAALLGSILLDRDAIGSVARLVSTQDFYDQRNGAVFQAALTLFRRREPTDLITLPAELDRTGTLARVGGMAYLSGLLTSTPTAVHAPYYASLIADAASKRRLISVAGRIAELGYDDSTNAGDAITEARLLLNQVAPDAAHERGMTIGDALAALAVEFDARCDGTWIDDVVPTGLYDLDKKLTGGGFERGQAITIGARPGMGKTAFALQIALNAVRRSQILESEPPWTVFFSSEMTTKALCWRALAESTGISVARLKQGIGLTHDQKRTIGDQLEAMLSLPLWIDDTSSPTVEQMHERIERLRADRPVRLAFFDYLEQAGDEKGRGENEETRVSKIAAGLKRIAKTSDITMVELSQLNRGVESRKTERYVPTMADIRQSGRVEQEADIVLLLYREDYYVQQGMLDATPGKAGTADVHIAKQRDGEQGVVTVAFLPELTSFKNLDRRTA